LKKYVVQPCYLTTLSNALFSGIEIKLMDEEYVSEVSINVNNTEFQGIVNWFENLEIEHTSEKTSYLHYLSMVN
jgi:hypothetical protein